MKLTSVAHTGFSVSNLDRSLAFYRDLLGMHVVNQQETDAAYVGTVTGIPGARLHIAHLRVTPDDPHKGDLVK